MLNSIINNLQILHRQQLSSVGLDQHSTLNVWNWKKGQIISTIRGHSDRVSSYVIIQILLIAEM